MVLNENNIKNLDAQTVAKLFERHRTMVNLGWSVIAVMIFCMFFGRFSTTLFISEVAAIVIWVLVILLNKRREIRLLNYIFVVNCDPMKYIEVVDALADKSKAAYNRLYFGKWTSYQYIVALIHAGLYEEALEKLEEIINKKYSLETKAAVNCYRALIYSRTDRLSEASQCLYVVDQALESGELKNSQIASIRFKKENTESVYLYYKGEYKKSAEMCRSMCNVIEGRGRVSEISVRFSVARAEYALGNFVAAYEYCARAHELVQGTPHPLKNKIDEMYEELSAKMNASVEQNNA